MPEQEKLERKSKRLQEMREQIDQFLEKIDDSGNSSAEKILELSKEYDRITDEIIRNLQENKKP